MQWSESQRNSREFGRISMYVAENGWYDAAARNSFTTGLRGANIRGCAMSFARDYTAPMSMCASIGAKSVGSLADDSCQDHVVGVLDEDRIVGQDQLVGDWMHAACFGMVERVALAEPCEDNDDFFRMQESGEASEFIGSRGLCYGLKRPTVTAGRRLKGQFLLSGAGPWAVDLKGIDGAGITFLTPPSLDGEQTVCGAPSGGGGDYKIGRGELSVIGSLVRATQTVTSDRYLRGTLTGKWGVAGDFALDPTFLGARYTHAGGTGTLSQTNANQQGSKIQTGKKYRLRIKVQSNGLTGATLQLSGVCAAPISIPVTADTYERDFVGVSGTLVLTVTSTGGTSMLISMVTVQTGESVPPETVTGGLGVPAIVPGFVKAMGLTRCM